MISTQLTFHPTLFVHSKEAIECHASRCYVAAAIMVRKTLEALCEDRGAKAPTLQERLRKLRDRITPLGELLTGLDHLKMLGNDAAHVEAKVYAEIGEKEVEVAIKFAKAVLKAVYQYQSLSEELRSFGEPSEPEAGRQ